MPQDILHWLTTAYFNMSPTLLREWINHFGNIENLFAASTTDLQLRGLTDKQIQIIKNPPWHQAEKDLQWCQQNHCHLILYADEHYPHLLREIFNAPLLLFVRGDINILNQPQLAMVGSRNPSIQGREHAQQFAYALAQAGLVITSGMALGIDAASHRGALSAEGKTIAVCGSGLKHIYPPTHHKLAEEIIQQGALVSELPPDAPARPMNFPLRNRIISGMSLGTFVVEAAMRSGSLITAKLAAEQAREVFAMPGSVHNPLTRGCHQLIRQGAKLIEKAQDILEELGSLKMALSDLKKSYKPLNLDKKYKRLLKIMGHERTSLDAIIVRSGLTAAEVSSMLLYLELEGYVNVAPEGYLRNS